MDNINSTEKFNLSITLIIGALKLQDKVLVKSCEKTLSDLLGSEYTSDIMTAVVFQLAQTDPDTFNWTWQNFYGLDACRNLIKGIVMFAVKKLINQGYILGQDFSINPTGTIWLCPKVKAALLEKSSATDRIFLEKILQIPSVT
ncbi:MAG: hypothetical protein F6K47_20795 [Symploca sp. SIO2E6]|nr:hypothetical protein [Symploca sp. SIO2E6]